jgi:hypothetical protein
MFAGAGEQEAEMVKRTKSCAVTVHLKGGQCLRGRYHVDKSTSSSVRPSDALRESTSPYLLLTDAVAQAGPELSAGAVIVVRADAVSFIELPEESWS